MLFLLGRIPHVPHHIFYVYVSSIKTLWLSGDGKVTYKCMILFKSLKLWKVCDFVIANVHFFLSFVSCFSVQHYSGGWQDWVKHEQHNQWSWNWKEIYIFIWRYFCNYSSLECEVMAQPCKGLKKSSWLLISMLKSQRGETSLLKSTSAIQYYLKPLFNFSQA